MARSVRTTTLLADGPADVPPAPAACSTAEFAALGERCDRLERRIARLERAEARRQRRRLDAVTDAGLVMAIALTLGPDVTFTARDLSERTRLDATLRSTIGRPTTRQIANRLVGLTSKPFAAGTIYFVTRIGAGNVYEFAKHAEP